ncbi:MAG: alpha/beta hydrolase-fold protein, partial [Rikenellaceae bacterium]
MKITIITSILLALALNLSAHKIDTLTIHSKVMNKDIPSLVITPDSYSDGIARNVVYLLHGFGDNYRGWVDNLKLNYSLADRYNVVLVLPDGAQSWYIDSPCDSSSRYETYICNELIPHIDSFYNTVKSRNGRAITGLSMGGHGALWLGINHQDLFSAAGSMSGGVDVRPFPKNWNLMNVLGDQKTHAENWDKYSVTNILSR